MAKHYDKAVNIIVEKDFLDKRTAICSIYGKPKHKWVEFCEYFLDKGYTISLYEAKETVSKYITLTHASCPDKAYKVRFSNHRPIAHLEYKGTCDFFVGITHTGTRTTREAAIAVNNYLKLGQIPI
jgi:hypothetical protein